MNRAQHRDSVRQEKFHFRVASESCLMSINEIINGCKDSFGLVPLVRRYLSDREDIDIRTRLTVERYLSLISERAAGNPTPFPCFYSRQSNLFRNSSNRCILDPTICCFSFCLQTRFCCFGANSIRSSLENCSNRKWA